MLEIMLPAIFPVQAPVQAQIQAPVAVPVVVNKPLVVDVPLVAAGVQPPVAMEVESDNEIFKRLFLQRFGRALPERNEVDDMVDNMDLIDLTKEDDEDEMEVATPVQAVVVVKTESIEAPIDDRRRSSRLERRGLRKSEVIPDKEAPAENVIADADTDMAEDTSVGSVNAVESVNSVESGNTIEPLTADEAFEMAEQAIAESDAAIAANQMVIDKFYDV